MRCPICKKPVDLNAPESPFCSPRCRTIDLGNWSSEKYVISTPANPLEVAEKAARPNGYHHDGYHHEDEDAD